MKSEEKDGALIPGTQRADAAERGITELKVGEHGSVVGSKLTGGNIGAPRVSDFYLIDTPMEPEAFVRLLNDEVLGNYDVQDHQGDAEFGFVVFKHIQGLPKPGTALPAGDRGPSPLAKVRPMLVVKLDAGPWPWYDNASTAILEGIVRRLGRRAWRCGWAIDKQWSWVEHWKVDQKTRQGKMTETIDGPANAVVTSEALERWGIDVRQAFDDLMRVVQWEALRQWLILPEPRPIPFAAHVSFTAGKLLIQDKDVEWIEPKWKEFFGDRDPIKGGALHLQRYYVPAPGVVKPPIPKDKLVESYKHEPKLLD
jgi:hypothetical protein